MKQKQFILASVVMLLSFVSLVFAQTNNNVAKVGATEYATIDEAIANWTNGTTLTLLANVQLSDVITLKSTEHHILNLDKYTMTAASGKNAIVIKACGTGDSERTAITIKADATNPGGINAGKKCVIYYKYADGGISGNDRPIIKIEGGVFTGSTSSWGTAGIYTIGTAARKCATLDISGGTFNCSINGDTKSKLIISGGVFNYSVGSQGDSTALRLISGGKFKTLGFMTADSNNTKFWFGTSMANSNVGLYVDDEGYLCVGGPVITELSPKYKAVASNATKWSSYLAYSSAATNGLYYTDADAAIKKHGAANVTVYEHADAAKELDNNAAVKDFTPELPSEVVTFEVEAIDIEATAEATTKVTFNVEPKNASGAKVSNPTVAITFRLPVPAAWSGKANVYHEGTLLGAYTIKEESGAKFVEVSSANFSEFAVEAIVPLFDGEGTEVSPYIIDSSDKLAALRNEVNGGEAYAGVFFKLTSDITLSDEWTAIGNGSRSSKSYTGNAFKGVFDGDNNTISGLTITSTTAADAAIGLFGVVDGGTIKNLNLTNVNINVPNSNLAGAAIGMMLNNATADNITVSGAVVGNDGVGGIVGRMIINGTIANCTNNASVTSNYGGIGGIVGKAYYEDGANTATFASITNCTNKGTIKAPMYVGGIAGLARANVSGCVNEGAIVGGTQTGGIVGQLMAAGTVSANENKATVGGTSHVGGIIGDYSQSGSYTYNNVSIVNNINRGELSAQQCAAIMGCNNIDGFTAMTAAGNQSFYYVEGLELFGNPEDMVIDATNKFILPTVAIVNGQEFSSFTEALEATKTMTGDVTVEIYDKVTFNQPLIGNYTSINFVGKDTDAEMYLDVQGYTIATGKKVSFTDLKLSKSEGGFIANAGFMNVAFGIYDVEEVAYTNCTFENGACASSGKVTFNGCTFKKSWDKYGLWAYGNVDVTVQGSTFADYRGIKMYAENGADASVEKANLTVKNTNFSAVDNKPAIVLTYGESVVLEGNTYSSTGTFELDLDGKPNGVAVTSDVAPVCVNDNGACGVLVDGKIYTTVAQAAEVATSSSTVTLLHNSAETVALPMGVTLNKNNFEAAGVTVAVPVAKIGDVEYATLAAAVEAAQAGETIILIADVKLTAQVVIPEGKELTLDLNGKTVNSVFNGTSTTNHIYALSNKGTLTIQDSKGNGSINSRGIYNYGSLTLNAGAINAIDGNGGYAVNNQNGSTFVMNGGVVAATYEDDHQSSSGGYDATALKVPAGCTATLNGGTINNVCDFTYAIDAAGTLNIPATSTITVNGTHGAIYVSGGVTTIDAGTFQIPADEYNRTDNVLYVSGGSLVVNGGTFIGDSDTAGGGSCLYDAAGKAVVNGGTFKGSSGGDVWGTTGTTIKGGTFENLTEKQHIAPGYELNADGTVAAKPVAKIGEVEYATLAAAVEAAQEDETITLIDNVVLAERVTIPADKTLTIDLNGKSISMEESIIATAYAINNLGNLTIKDSVGGGSINSRGMYNGYGDGGDNVASATITILGGTFNAKGTNGGGAAIFNYGVADIQGGTFTSVASYAIALQTGSTMTIGENAIITGGINSWQSTLTITGGTISNDKSGKHVVYAGESAVTINGGTFHNNNSGNATIMASGSTAAVEITGGTFTLNIVDASSSYLIDATSSATCTISGGSFTGGIRAQGGTKYEITGGTFTNEYGNYNVYEGGDINISGGTFTGSYAQKFATDNLAAGYELGANGAVGKASVAEVNDVKYASFAEAAAAAQAGDEIKLLANIDGDVTVPANVTLNGNGFAISGGILAEGDITFAGVTTAADFDANVVNTAVNIPAGASLQLTGTARLVIGHGATFNITGTIEDAKTADKATLVPSLKIAAGASITGNGVTFNVNNAYIVANANTTSKNSSANGTLDFNINNSIWEQTGVLAFYVPTSGKDPVVNFELKNSVLTTTSHLVFSVTKGEVVIDNSLVNEGTQRQLENRSTMTIKNGSVVNGAVATSSNAINPGTIIVENATYAVTGEFSGAAEGTGTLVIKKGANVSVGSIKAGANVTVDAEGMAAGDEINFTANLSQFTGTLSVINNDKLEASIVNGKIVLNSIVAKIGDAKFTSLQAAIEAVQEGETITLVDDVNVTTPAYGQNALNHARAINFTLDLNGKTLSANTGNSVFRFNIANSGATSDVTLTIKNGTIVAGSNTWCAVMASGISADVKAIMNLENLTIESSKANDMAVKSWSNATINAKNVTVNATNAAGGFYAVGGEIVLDECTVNQKGLYISPYMSMAFAVSSNGKMTINSGTYSAEPTAAAEGSNQGSTHGSWVGGVMNSGGELIINGGTFSNGNFGDDALATAARGLIFADTNGKVTVNGGTFNALKSIFDFQNNLAGTSPVITVKGGNYSADPAVVTSYGSIVLDANCVVVENNGVWNVVKAAAKIGTVKYTSLEAAFKAATSGCTIDILSDVTVDYNWDARYTGAKFTVPVTINGNGKTIKFTNSVNDNNYQAPFRFEADATVKNLTIDMSEVTDNRFRAISSKGNLTVDGCKFIGKDETLNCRAIIFGEGAGANVGNLAISITNSEFINWKRGITDNENAQDVKTVTITGNTMTDAGVGVSAKETVTFTGNTVAGAYVNIKSYTAGNKLAVTATGNTLEVNTDESGKFNVIDAGGVVNAEGFKVVAKGNNFNGYTGTDGIWGEVWGNARESFVIKVLDANDNVMGTTSLNNVGGIIDGDVNVSWNLKFNAAANNDEYWTMAWTTAPTLNNMPAKVELWVDGTRVGGGPVVLNGPDDLNKINVIVTDAEGKVTSCQTTVANALTAAKDGETVNLLWKDGQAPLAMNGSVFGKNVTIAGTAKVDWNKGFLFVGRGGAGNATVTFDGANLTSASNSSSYGIHVSGREKNTTNKYDGTLVIKNSTIELDYLINRNAIELDNATLTVKNGFAIAGRPASETENAANATATINLANSSKVVVNNHNGMGLGQAASVLEGFGVMNVDATSAFETTQGFVVTVNGTMNIAGNATIAGTLTNEGAINLTSENATLKAQAGLTINSTVEGRDVIYADGVYTTKLGLKGKGTEAEPYLIYNVKELVAFRNSVNEGETKYSAPGIWVALGADIDMTGENWVGIGSATADHGFMGNFDGKNFKIKNLTITNPALDSDGYAYAGLFGVTEGTDKNNQNTIKNLTIENVTISTTGDIVSAAIAYPYYTIVDNVKVCGDIKIQGGNYTAGVLAYTRRCVNASNLSIVGNDGSFVKGNQTVGGVISDIQMNGGLTAVYSNFSAEGITVSGEKSVGGIAGIIATQTLNGATVKNVTLNSSDARVGIVAGCLGGTSTISNVTYEDVTGAATLIGASYDNAKAVAAKIGDTYYATLEAALAAEGNEVELLSTYEVAAGETKTLDLKGKTVIGTPVEAKAYAVIINKGNLTITGNGSVICNHTLAGSTGYAVNTITNGGTLTIDGATIENKSTAQYQIGYAIDNNSTTGDAIINIKAGKVIASGSNYYDGIRLFCNSMTKKNDVIVSGGEVSTIWMQNPSDGAEKNTKDVAGNVVISGGNVGVLSLEPSANFEAAVTGGHIGEISYFQTAEGRDLVQFVTAGTFGNDVNQFCALGYQAQADAEGLYTVKYTGKVAEFTIVDGEYTEFNIEDSVEVGTLTYTRTIYEGWNALYVPFEIPVNELTNDFEVAYINDMHWVDKNDDFTMQTSEMTMEVIKIKNGTLKANHPYIIRPKNGAEIAMNLVLNNVILHKTSEKVDVEFSSAYVEYKVSGTYTKAGVDILNNGNDIYIVSGDNFGVMNNAYPLPAFRIFMTVENKGGSPVIIDQSAPIRIRVAGEKDEATGIITPIIEGDVHVNDGTVYDLMGRPVRTPEKGKIYIMNGKKVLF